MKIYHVIILIILIIAILFVVSIFGVHHNIDSFNNTSMNNTIELKNATITHPTPIIDANVTEYTNNNTHSIDGNDVFNSINWSRYSSIERCGVHNNEVSEPTYVINHSFLKFTIDVYIKDPENTRELFRELACIVIEIRQKIGPNSSISVVGLVDGMYSYSVDMLPYDDRLYASDNYHPQAYKMTPLKICL